MNLQPTIPQEHQLKCPTCGATIDLRDLGQVLSHGMWNDYTERYECKPEPQTVQYETSRKIGDPVEWTKDKKPINLN